ncbi:RecB family exonuclease [Streptomyces sp. NPDC014801]|uniref:RecB family exonuclease n=1 Tax=Streptomyces sp. NPDC014801 TaxID=3364916 RepID=UPI0036F53409
MREAATANAEETGATADTPSIRPVPGSAPAGLPTGGSAPAAAAPSGSAGAAPAQPAGQASPSPATTGSPEASAPSAATGTPGDSATNADSAADAEPVTDDPASDAADAAADAAVDPAVVETSVASAEDGHPEAAAVAVVARAERGGPVSLSPSRAGDFMQCPLLYRFRVIDRLPEKPSAAATRGTLVHAVLERLFDAPAAERTAPRAKSLIPGQWERLRESRPEVAELFADDPEGERLAQWLTEAEQLVERWFTLEDPTRLEPAERELFVETELESGLTLRGIIDRVDVAPTGEVRIVDYKTGKAPRPEYAEGALFQMKFYALVVWRLKQVIPRRLQLVYLGSGDVLTYDPVRADLERVERKLLALWEAIRHATETGDWRPRPTKLCGWCDHQAHCPEFGGTPPPYPLPVRVAGPGDA